MRGEGEDEVEAYRRASTEGACMARVHVHVYAPARDVYVYVYVYVYVHVYAPARDAARLPEQRGCMMCGVVKHCIEEDCIR